MALSKRRAEAIITVIGEDQFTAMMDELKNDIGDKVGGAVKDVNKNWAVMATGVKSVVDLVGQAVGAAGQLLTVLKSAANQQAVSTQFDRMGLSIGRIRDAAQGTISDGALKRPVGSARLRGSLQRPMPWRRCPIRSLVPVTATLRSSAFCLTCRRPLRSSPLK